MSPGVLLLAVALVGPPALDRGDWREFDRRPGGWAESVFVYDAASLVRHGDRVTAWISWEIHLSGLTNPRFFLRIETACARRSSRSIAGYEVQGGRSRRLRATRGAEPIAPDGIPAALADRLCPTTPAAPEHSTTPPTSPRGA